MEIPMDGSHGTCRGLTSYRIKKSLILPVKISYIDIALKETIY